MSEELIEEMARKYYKALEKKVEELEHEQAVAEQITQSIRIFNDDINGFKEFQKDYRLLANLRDETVRMLEKKVVELEQKTGTGTILKHEKKIAQLEDRIDKMAAEFSKLQAK